MIPTTAQVLARVRELLVTGARLHFWDGQPSIPLQFVEWIDGRGLLIAELGLLDQSGVHLIEAHSLSLDGDADLATAREFDLLTESGALVASIYPSTERPAPVGEGWAEFWAQEIRNAKGGE